MYIIRPITLDDLTPLVELTRLTGFGLTTLPNDERLLKRRIKESLRGFENLADEDPPIGETYLFVMEHLPTKQICGTCGIVSKVGGFEPFYAYRIETSIHQSEALHVRKEIQMLHLVEMHSGPCEIGSLFLSPDHRGGGNGRLLSLSRFLFMANYPAYFDPMVIAEMRGVLDQQGHSPFWDAVGRWSISVSSPT
jgi:arginine N-succinyltransferase